MINVKRISHATFETPDLDRQIDYFTQIAGLGWRSGKTAAPSSPPSSAISRSSSSRATHGALCATGVPGCARHRVRRHPARHRGRGPALSDAQRSKSRHPQDAGVRGSQGNGVRGICARRRRSARSRRSRASGRSSSAILRSSSRTRRTYADFYCRVLGFRVSDWIADWFVFMRCGPDHHTVNFVRGKRTQMHHIAFELKDWAHIQAACDFLGSRNIPIIWGPGRHGPGHNVYTYHRNPDDQIIEMFTELDKMLDELLGYFDPRPWHRDRPQVPKVWSIRPTSGGRRRRRTTCGSANEPLRIDIETAHARHAGGHRMSGKILGALVLLAALTGAAAAQDYPTRPIKFMHGFPPGGNVDIIARLLGNEMSKGLGQSIIIEAKPGVAGSLAAEAVARSDPDGYTLLVVPSAHPAHGALSRNVKYKVVDDFEWISVASFYPFLICVRQDSRFADARTVDRRGAQDAGRPEIRLRRRGLDPAHHGRAHGQRDQDHLPAHSLSRRSAGDHRAAAGRHRFHRGDVGSDQRAHPLRASSARSRSPARRAGAISPTCRRSRSKAFPDSRSSPGPGLPVPRSCRTHRRQAQRRAAPRHRGARREGKLESMGGDPRATTPDEMRALVASQLATWTKLAKEAGIAID